MVFTMHTTRYLFLRYKDNPTKQAQVVTEFAMRQRNPPPVALRPSTEFNGQLWSLRQEKWPDQHQPTLNLENSAPLRELHHQGYTSRPPGNKKEQGQTQTPLAA